nr:ferredoxin [Amycolatopsis taiwanensis]
MVIEADTSRCVGAGMCALVAPGLFDQTDEDGSVVVVHRVVSGEAVEQALECEYNCPSGAIRTRVAERSSGNHT